MLLCCGRGKQRCTVFKGVNSHASCHVIGAVVLETSSQGAALGLHSETFIASVVLAEKLIPPGFCPRFAHSLSPM